MEKLGWSFSSIAESLHPDKLSCPSQECDELIAIFVTIINRAKDKLLLPFTFCLLPFPFFRAEDDAATSARTEPRPTRSLVPAATNLLVSVSDKS
jgi:hypothetical protein